MRSLGRHSDGVSEAVESGRVPILDRLGVD